MKPRPTCLKNFHFEVHQNHYSLHLLISFAKLPSIYFSIVSLNKREPLFVLLVCDLVCVTLFHEYIEYRVGFGMHPQHSRTIWNLSTIFWCIPLLGSSLIYLCISYCNCSILILSSSLSIWEDMQGDIWCCGGYKRMLKS